MNYSEVDFLMDNLTDLTVDATKLLEVGGRFYLAFLAFWKIANPYPMRHEREHEPEHEPEHDN